jgi:hypothetical protein
MWFRTKHIREISHLQVRQTNGIVSRPFNKIPQKKNALRRFSPKVEIGNSNADKSIMRARDNWLHNTEYSPKQ